MTPLLFDHAGPCIGCGRAVADPFAFYCPVRLDRERFAARARGAGDDEVKARIISRWR